MTCNDFRAGLDDEENDVRTEPEWAAPALAERAGEVSDLAAAVDRELSQREAAERWNVDPTTIMRIRRVGREGALEALAQSKPGRRQGAGGEDAQLRAAREEIARLEETVKEQAIELVALRGKTRSGW